MENVVVIEYGMGIDLHGQDVTKAAVRAVQDAIRHNSLPGLRSLVPNQDPNNMKVNVRLAVPADKEKLELDQVKAAFPYGEISFEVVDGGMLTSSGIILEDKGDTNDLAYVVIASIQVGY